MDFLLCCLLHSQWRLISPWDSYNSKSSSVHYREIICILKWVWISVIIIQKTSLGFFEQITYIWDIGWFIRVAGQWPTLQSIMSLEFPTSFSALDGIKCKIKTSARSHWHIQNICLNPSTYLTTVITLLLSKGISCFKMY